MWISKQEYDESGPSIVHRSASKRSPLRNECDGSEGRHPLVAYLREYGKQRKQRDARSGFSVTVGCSEFESAQASLLHSSVGEWWSRWAAGMAFINDVLDYLKQFLHTRLRLMLA